MKTSRFTPFYRIVPFFIFVVGALYCTGCGDFVKDMLHAGDPPTPPGVYEIAEMSIIDVEAYIGEGAPPEVFVRVVGSMVGCTVHHQTHQQGKGFRITITITTITPIEPVPACTTDVRLYYETIALGTLPAGNYQIIVNDVERQLRVD